MIALLVTAMLLAMFSIAFPPLLLITIPLLVWFWKIYSGRIDDIRAARAVAVAAQQAKYDKAVAADRAKGINYFS